MRKYIVTLAMLTLVLTSCTPKGTTTAVQEEVTITTEEAVAETSASKDSMVSDDNMIKLTLEELKTYDGTNGNPAYIAVDGKIYDVTNVPNWNGGEHNGFKAGLDLTDEMKNIAPHGTSKLQYVDQIGIIVE